MSLDNNILMFNYKSKNIDYEYPFPNELFVKFLLGKKESDYNSYFGDLIKIVKDYDSLSKGSDHIDFYEFNYSFFLKFLNVIKGRFNVVFDKIKKVIYFKDQIFLVAKDNFLTDPKIMMDSSMFYINIGKINSNFTMLVALYDSIDKLHKSYFERSDHEMDLNSFLDEVNKVKKIISESVSYLNKINSDLETLGLNISNLLSIYIKAKVLNIKNNLYSRYDDLIYNAHTANPNVSLNLDKYEEDFNRTIHSEIAQELIHFNKLVVNCLKVLPVIICESGKRNTSNELILSFEEQIQGIIGISSKTNYFNTFKIHYNKTHAA